MSIKKIIVFIFVSTFLVGCSSENKKSFQISGKINNLDNNEIILSKITDIQKNTKKVIDTLRVDKLGNFNSLYFLEPGIYSLLIDSEKLKLAIDYNQNIIITKNTPEELILTHDQLSWLLAGLDFTTMHNFGELNYCNYY